MMKSWVGRPQPNTFHHAWLFRAFFLLFLPPPPMASRLRRSVYLLIDTACPSCFPVCLALPFPLLVCSMTPGPRVGSSDVCC